MTIATKVTFPNRYDIVGSFLRTARLKQARQDFTDNKITHDNLITIQHEETKKLVDQEIAAGLKDITDGEFNRSWWHHDFFEGLNGVHHFTPEHGYFFHGEETRKNGVEIDGPVTYNPDHPFFHDFEFLNSLVPEDCTAKQTIPSPTVFFPGQKKATVVDSYYDDDLAAFLKDEIAAYQATIQHFYDLGCRYLQLDDTSWGRWVSGSEGVLNPEFKPLCEAAVAAINALADNKPDDLTLTMHVCRGNYDSHWMGAGAYDPVADYLAQLHIDGFFLEYDDERSGGFEPLKKIADNGRNQRIVLGLITSKYPELETQAVLKHRIEQASQYVPLDNLCLSPQCGFASTEEGNRLTEDEQWAKIKLVIDTAKAVWADAE